MNPTASIRKPCKPGTLAFGPEHSAARPEAAECGVLTQWPGEADGFRNGSNRPAMGRWEKDGMDWSELEPQFIALLF